MIDFLQCYNEQEQPKHHLVKCLHPFEASKCTWVTPTKVENLHKCTFLNGKRIEERLSLSIFEITLRILCKH